MTPEDQAMKRIVDGISNYIHSEDARMTIATQLKQNAGQLPDVMGSIAYEIIQQVAKQIEQTDPEMLELEVLLVAVAETIDLLMEVAQAIGIPIESEDQMRQETLFKVIQAHMAVVGDDPETKAEMRNVMAQLVQDGTWQESINTIDAMVQERGGDVSQYRAMGQSMAFPKNPVSAGVQRGLMGG